MLRTFVVSGCLKSEEIAMRKILPCCLLLLLSAGSVAAQVQLDVRLEKTRYLAGEPIVLVVDVLNVGDEPVAYSVGDGAVSLTIAGVQRRVLTNIFGCFSGTGSGSGASTVSHPPLLPPGQSTSFRYLLRDYDLKPGSYELTAAGRAGLRWKYYPVLVTPNTPPQPPPKHRETDPVPGAEFKRSLVFNVAAATEEELKAVLLPLLAAADGSDPLKRYEARAALIESAPPFLVSVIARFAAEDRYNPLAIEALGRMATPASRAHLKDLWRTASGNPAIVLALARIGHRDDADFFATVLHDEGIVGTSRSYAALALGRLGGDDSVRELERALPSAPERLLVAIVTALGNTRSRTAVPVIIGVFGNNPARNAVCGALKTLTHQAWCGGSAADSAATRRQWLRRWNDEGSNTPIFGADDCRTDTTATAAFSPAPPQPRPAPSGPPTIVAPSPGFAAPNSFLGVSGYDFGLEDRRTARAIFIQGTTEHVADFNGPSWTESPGSRRYYSVDIRVPAELAPGQWALVIESNGVRSEAIPVVIRTASELAIAGLSPPRPHPSQLVRLSTRSFAQVVDFVQVTDARGGTWRIPTGGSTTGIGFTLPDDVVDGEANVRLGRTENGVDRLSEPWSFLITSGPLPLSPAAVTAMTPVGPGQWTDLGRDHVIEFEMSRADRIDVEFRQGALALTNRATGPNKDHVQVPRRLNPGDVDVRTRTWIGRIASEWSEPALFRVLQEPVPPSITFIGVGLTQRLVWSSGDRDTVVQTQPGEALVLRGHFPVTSARDLRVQLRSGRRILDLPAVDVDGGVRVIIPRQAASNEWRIVVAARDRSTDPQDIATVHVMDR
jgi:hypothetical protein